jgi:hypothetical protein
MRPSRGTQADDELVALNLAAAEPLEINSGNPSKQTIEDDNLGEDGREEAGQRPVQLILKLIG